MLLLLAACAALLIAFFNAVLFSRNLIIYRVPLLAPDSNPLPSVSVLIPARNEEAVIRTAVESALQSRSVKVEVIVLDDHSDDRTSEIVAAMAQRDTRVRVYAAPPLPPHWCGKQFACSVLAELASYQTLCFMDSDVRLKPAGLAHMTAFLQQTRSALVSGFPEQEMVTFFEKLLLPMMHFLLLSFLPIDTMRRYLATSLGAGCGQLFVADRESYRRSGGHAAIRNSRHDGIALPRAFRRARLRTDICDATGVATCRMYHNAFEVFGGLLKNATEGIAAPVTIFVFTALLGIGHILPWVLCLLCVFTKHNGLPLLLSALATALSLLPRVVAARYFRQPMREALLHPLAIVVFLILQWWARIRVITGTPAVWKGRRYQTT